MRGFKGALVPLAGGFGGGGIIGFEVGGGGTLKAAGVADGGPVGVVLQAGEGGGGGTAMIGTA